jgi:hypothetical protein
MSFLSKVTKEAAAPAAAATPAAASAAAAPAAAGAGGDEDATYRWDCEFCCAINTGLRLAPEELPEAMAGAGGTGAVPSPAPVTSALPGGRLLSAVAPGGGGAAPVMRGVDYLLVPPPIADDAAGGDAAAAAGAGVGGGDKPAEDTSAIVFVSDTSGSMCITEPLADAVARRLRGAEERRAELARLRGAGDDANQFLPGERRGVTYVSRIQALQAAITQQVRGTDAGIGGGAVLGWVGCDSVCGCL